MVAPIFQVDAFTDLAFTGNPAAVVLLDRPADPAWMQAVAAEMNLAETAFVEPGSSRPLRWFTPTVEVDLCGHATLSAAHVLWSEGLERPDVPLSFETRSGTLWAARTGEAIELDLPAAPPTPFVLAPEVVEMLGVDPVGAARSTFDLVEVASAAEVRDASPDLERLAGHLRAFVLTARDGDRVVCRVFSPAFGIPEDPVTGSAQCVLAPWWAPRLGRDEFDVRQLSARGGALQVRLAGDRVRVAGRAVTVLRGELLV